MWTNCSKVQTIWKLFLKEFCSFSVSERLPAGRKVVLRPEQLTADFHQLNGTLLSTFRWRMSQHALDPGAVEGFQFTWTLQSELKSDVDRPEHALISQTQTIASVRQRKYFVLGKRGGFVYCLRKRGAGGFSVFLFLMKQANFNVYRDFSLWSKMCYFHPCFCFSQTQRSVTVRGLQAGSVYQLQLQVLTAGGRKGAAVSKTIHTPTINTSLL